MGKLDWIRQIYLNGIKVKLGKNIGLFTHKI